MWFDIIFGVFLLKKIHISWFLSSLRFYVKSILGDSRSAKSAILSHLEALDFDFHEFTSPDMSKKGSFGTSRIPKIDFT